MIRLLTRQDHDRILSYLNRNPLQNIYLIHALQTGCFIRSGPSSNRITLWGAFDGERLEGVLCVNCERRPCAGYLAGETPQVLARLGKLAHQSGAGTLVGNQAFLQPAIADLGTRIHVNTKRLNFYRANPEGLVRYYDYPVRIATTQDIPCLVALYRGYEFARKNRTDRETEAEITGAMDRSGVYFVLESEGRVVSAARVFPQTDQAGMIGAARTLPEFRGRGMYLSVRTACFEHLFSQGKTGLGVFADTNRSMHRVLDKQGGSIMSEWLIVRITTKPPLRRRILPQSIRRRILGVKDLISRARNEALKGRNG